ncbi:MAG: hypothetical protein MSH10_07615 [Pygmaiobacter massiliensis]|nr:hypothetical protein [Pygmaiobacter massiliensis]
MALNTLCYLAFLLVVAAGYYLLPGRFQKGILLVASLGFYWLSSARLIFVMLAGWLFCWAAGIFIEKQPKTTARRAGTAAAIGFLVGVLAVFKYATFFAGWLGLSDQFQLAMPLGISFYSFMAIGYLADVAAKRCKAVHNGLDLLVFLCFFGTVSSGPILRANQFLPQLASPKRFQPEGAMRAFSQIGLGLFYKVAVSDLLAVLANAIYADVYRYTGLTLFFGSLCYTFQLYFDFAGYSLLAKGSAELLGFSVPQNFNAPYFSRSIKEFWTRWHMSLSGWLRDYVYIPLGGNRKGKARKWLNLMLTFAVSGVWHGAGLCFLVWGLLHGFLQVLGEWLLPVRKALWRAVRINPDGRFASCVKCLCTFFMVNALWVFFRAGTFKQALWVLRGQFLGLSLQTFGQDIWNILLTDFNPKPILALGFVAFLTVSFLVAVALDAATRFQSREGQIGLWLLERRPALLRWVWYYVLAGLTFGGYVLNNGYFTAAVSFIYNNF